MDAQKLMEQVESWRNGICYSLSVQIRIAEAIKDIMKDESEKEILDSRMLEPVQKIYDHLSEFMVRGYGKEDIIYRFKPIGFGDVVDVTWIIGENDQETIFNLLTWAAPLWGLPTEFIDDFELWKTMQEFNQIIDPLVHHE